jgi:DUF2933 family protein
MSTLGGALWWGRNRLARWVCAGLIAVAVYLLVAEHRSHVVQALPWLVLLACPLMHSFMHRRHGGQQNL